MVTEEIEGLEQVEIASCPRVILVINEVLSTVGALMIVISLLNAGCGREALRE